MDECREVRAVELERVNLNLLVPLSVLLETRNVTRAGEQLHLSQSATSAILSRLRTALGDPLLVKSGREMTLTPYAEQLVGPLAVVLSDIDHLFTHRPRFNPETDRRNFKLIASDYSALFLVRPLLEVLATEAPEVTVEVHPLLDDYADQVRHDAADLLVVSEQLCSEHLPEFPRRAMFRDTFVLAAWEGNEAVQDGVTVEDFRLLRFVQYVTGQRLNLADRALDELGVVRQVEVRTTSQLVVPWLLTGTPLVALIPSRLADLARRDARLRVLQPPVALPVISVACTWHPRRSQDGAHSWLLDRLTAVAAHL